MEPFQYLDKIRPELFKIILAQHEKEDPLAVVGVVPSNDVRLALKAYVNHMHSNKKPKDSKYLRRRRCAEWLLEQFNAFAHDHAIKAEEMAVNISSNISFFLRELDDPNPRAIEVIEKFNSDVIKRVFGEAADPEPFSANADTFNAQLDVINEKLDSVLGKLSPAKVDPQPVQVSDRGDARSRRDALLRIRQEIFDHWRKNGKDLSPVEQILQLGHVDRLLKDQPRSLDELEAWLATMPSYKYNVAVMRRQVERWGSEIIEVLIAKSETEVRKA